MTKTTWASAVALLIFAQLPSMACAHGLGVEARLTKGELRVEAFYDDDSPARNARVVVINSEGSKIAEGQTNHEGVWQIAAPPAGKYRIIIHAQDAHRAETRLVVPEAEASARSAGPSRHDFTRFPWERLLLGLLIIALLAWFTRRFLARRPHNHQPSGNQEDSGRVARSQDPAA